MTDMPVLDIPAWLAYVIVMIVAVLTAVSNINRLLGAHPGYWRFWRTWVLFFWYLFIPFVLFYLLDRLNVIDDTSLFAAILVGFAYQQIMSGGIAGVSLPGGAAKVWKPFETYANELADKISDQQVAHATRMADSLGKELSADAKLAQLFVLVMERASDPQKLRDELRDIDQIGTLSLANVDLEGAVRRRKAERLLREMRQTNAETWEELLLERRLLTRWQYYRWRQAGVSSHVAGLVGFALLAAALLGSTYLVRSDSARDWYYSWRLRKPNTTSWDQVRAMNYFRKHDPAKLVQHSFVLSPVAMRLAAPDLEPLVTQRILAAIAYLRRIELDEAFVPQLINALTTTSADARLRINELLLDVAGTSYLEFPVDSVLIKWIPAVGEGPTQVQAKARLWQDWWTRTRQRQVSRATDTASGNP
jgi:hypothetical protein